MQKGEVIVNLLVTTEVELREVDNDEPVAKKVGDIKILAKPMLVKSHWNRSEWVVLAFPGALPVAVDVEELKMAIANATNC